MADISALIDPQLGWELVAAEAINNNGQIVGFGTFEGEEYHGYLRIPSPVPGPATMLLFGLGLLGMAGNVQKKTDIG